MWVNGSLETWNLLQEKISKQSRKFGSEVWLRSKMFETNQHRKFGPGIEFISCGLLFIVWNDVEDKNSKALQPCCKQSLEATKSPSKAKTLQTMLSRVKHHSMWIEIDANPQLWYGLQKLQQKMLVVRQNANLERENRNISLRIVKEKKWIGVNDSFVRIIIVEVSSMILYFFETSITDALLTTRFEAFHLFIFSASIEWKKRNFRNEEKVFLNEMTERVDVFTLSLSLTLPRWLMK